MIYLLRSYGPKEKSILKIGFSDNIDNRLSQYFYHNPYSEVVSTREGDEVLESLLHLYLKFLGFQYKKNGKLNEWFMNDNRVYQVFHISQESLEKKIWKHREKIFDKSKMSTSNKITEDYKIFEYLWEKNKENFEGERIIFKDGKLVQTDSKEVDILFWKFWRKRCKEYQNPVFFCQCRNNRKRNSRWLGRRLLQLRHHPILLHQRTCFGAYCSRYCRQRGKNKKLLFTDERKLLSCLLYRRRRIGNFGGLCVSGELLLCRHRFQCRKSYGWRYEYQREQQ